MCYFQQEVEVLHIVIEIPKKTKSFSMTENPIIVIPNKPLLQWKQLSMKLKKDIFHYTWAQKWWANALGLYTGAIKTAQTGAPMSMHKPVL